MKDLLQRVAVASGIFLLVFYSCKNAKGQDTTQEDTVLRKGSFVPLPVIFAAPENGVGFGALGIYLFKFDYDDTNTRRSNIQASFIYTTKNQILTNVQYTIFSNLEKYLFLGEVNYNVFTDFYYGIGQTTPNENEETVDYDLVSFEHRFLRKLRRHMFAGLEFRHFQRYNFDREEDGLLETTEVAGFDGSVVSGIGPFFVFDSRDIVVNPTKGAYVEFSATYHGNYLGGEYTFGRYRLDARKYFKISKKKRHILALQFLGSFIDGTASFKQLSELGGDNTMRGYFQGRFRDQHLMAFQSEFRFPVWWRFGAVVFAGLGNVANDFSEFDFQNTKPSYGAGVRFAINRKENLNIRIDYGLGSDGNTGFYFNIVEAF